MPVTVAEEHLPAEKLDELILLHSKDEDLTLRNALMELRGLRYFWHRNTNVGYYKESNGCTYRINNQ